MDGKFKVLITEASYKTSLWVARSLHNDKFEIYAIDTTKGGALVSRYTDYPIITKKEEYLNTIFKIIQEKKIDVVVPHLESTYIKLQDSFKEGRIRIVAPEKSLADVVSDKIKVINLVKDLVKLPYTKIYEIKDSDSKQGVFTEIYGTVVSSHKDFILKASTEIGKNFGPFSRYIVLNHRNIDSIKKRIYKFLNENENVIFQEYIKGSGIGIGGFWLNGEPILVGGHKRLIESHSSGGISVLAESYIHSDAFIFAKNVMKKLGYTGIGMVEFKLGHDNVPYFMEINPRMWGTLPLYIYAGLDIPKLAVYYYLGLQIEDIKYQFHEGKRMFFFKDFMTYLPRNIDNLLFLSKSFFKNLNKIKKSRECSYSREDIYPFLYDIFLIMRYYIKSGLKLPYKFTRFIYGVF
ncbi:MAG: ATP-grasp domain-containing protein [bacterium]